MPTILLDNFNRGSLTTPFHLENHTVDTTGTGVWHNTAVLPGNLIVSSTNTVYPDSASGALYYNDQTYTDNLETITGVITVKSDLAGSNGFTARASSGADTELLFRISTPGNGTAAMQVIQFAAGSPTQIGVNQILGSGSYPAYVVGHSYALVVTMHNSTFDMTVQDVTAASSVVAVFTGQSFTGLTSTGFVGIRADGSFGDTTGLHMDSLTVADGGAALAVGNLGDMVVTGQFSASVTCPTPTGGGGSYTYQWHSSTTVNFTPDGTSLIGGATAQTVSFTGLTPNTNLWVVCQVSDGTTTVNTFHRLVRVGGLVPISLGIIGDSTSRISAGVENPLGATIAPMECTYQLRVRGGARQVTITNPSVSGTSTANWQSGGTNMTTALAAFAAASPPVTHVILRLGCNDAQGLVDTTTFNSNYSNIVSTLTGAGYKVFLDYPTWREPGVDFEAQGTTFDETYTPFLLAYLPIIDSYINNITVFRGGQVHIWLSMSQPFTMLDNTAAIPGAIHWSDIGSVVAGGLDAASILAVTNPSLSLTITLNGSNQPVLNWQADLAATNYKVYRTASGSLTDPVLLAIVAGGTTTYTDTTAASGQEWYEVVAVH